jgi:hypothetical protein
MRASSRRATRGARCAGGKDPDEIAGTHHIMTIFEHCQPVPSDSLHMARKLQKIGAELLFGERPSR